MALVIADRVQETCTSPGTGTITLLGAVTGFRTFGAAIGNTNTTFYAIADVTGSNWEVGLGTYSSTGNTLARTTVLASSNAGSLVNFSSGTQNVWGDYPAGKAMLLDASSKVNAGGNGYLDFPSAAPTTIAGRMWYNDTTGTWNLGMGGGNITQQVGEELFVYGKATAAISGNTIVQAVYQTGTVGASGAITFAPTVSGITNGDLILGVATEDIANNGFGRITSFGVIHGVDTTGSTYGETWANGNTLWYNPVTGGVTNVKPVAPNIKVQLGVVINAGSGGSGSLQVEISHGSVLGGTDSNVQLTSPADQQLLQYYAAGQYWRNVDLSSIQPTGAYTRTNITATAGQTSFSVTYQVGFIFVYLNGVLLNSSDYTATTGTTVVLASGALAGDIVSFVVLSINSIGNAGNITGGVAGAVLWQSGVNATGFTAAGTSGQALLSGGATTPTWGTLEIGAGGSGQTTAQAAMNAFAGAVTSGSYLRGNGTNVVMSAIQAADVTGALGFTPQPVGLTMSGQLFGVTRASGTTYTNSSGHTMFVYFGGSNSPSNGYFVCTVAGASFKFDGYGNQPGGFFCVPNGMTYSITVNGVTIQTWYEAS